MPRPSDSRMPPEVSDPLAAGTCLRLVLSAPRPGAPAPWSKVEIRPVMMKSGPCWQCTLIDQRQALHVNLNTGQALAQVAEWLQSQFQQVLVCTPGADFHLTARGRNFRVKTGPPTQAASGQAHDRTKAYLIPEGVPCPFLVETGVMTPAGQVRRAMHHKFRQINRFLELVNDVVPDLPARDPLRIVDYGCGKSYLTFAIHHLLTAHHRREVELVGLDRQANVVARCQELAGRLHCRGLTFLPEEISRYRPDAAIDLAISLHACDTATDDALAQAVRWNSRVILAVPCCQHELAPALRVAGLAPVSRHGILHERLAALVTDALRALALEAAGYAAQIIEFIDLEHTAKNVLIRARRRARVDPALLAARRAELEQLLTNCSLTETRLTRALAAILADRPGGPAEPEVVPADATGAAGLPRGSA